MLSSGCEARARADSAPRAAQTLRRLRAPTARAHATVAPPHAAQLLSRARDKVPAEDGRGEQARSHEAQRGRGSARGRRRALSAPPLADPSASLARADEHAGDDGGSADDGGMRDDADDGGMRDDAGPHRARRRSLSPSLWCATGTRRPPLVHAIGGMPARARRPPALLDLPPSLDFAFL